ncbi:MULTISPECIES: hypothetical protein [unclassified Breznakia]|uniref:hypothetical protein n=1 Tax=unclassified Breznakia TaxID=2623764 RepID=UPI00247618FB|nr:MULTISPECIES: hypothetical protein [unclassified Breznakia]MDH6367147.1 hypothetical protein [Breznakia sp. PH1-1]MDH6404266.1 hypothetical protein [Breznakia sp. PF1-11]MDH6412035.1 hypothetical protein [Breznakia sp. PFB1-11]MDH6414254.1 hypothetical protein [Breznakia sp. PFB1-14]MDH6416649.1 hypothetical protein [Breznakia sp. PFB1-4]
MPNDRHRAVARAKRNRINAEYAHMFTWKGHMKMANELPEFLRKDFQVGIEEMNDMSKRREDERGH